jgi:hypothetical protein
MVVSLLFYYLRVPDGLFCVRKSQHGLGLKKEGKKQNIIDPVFNSSAVLFINCKINYHLYSIIYTVYSIYYYYLQLHFVEKEE